MATHVLRLPISTGDTSLTKAVRDDLITGDNGGVLFCADLGFGWSYPAGTLPRPAPADPLVDAVIRDLTGNGDAKVSSSDETCSIQYLGGGFDFSNISGAPREVGIDIPATVSADIYTNQNYLFCAYMKLPSLANWNASASLNSMITATDNGLSYQTGTEIFTVALQQPSATNGKLSIRAQDNTGTAVQIPLEVPTGQGFYSDQVVQVAVYVDDGNLYARIKTSLGEVSGSIAFTGNALDFSAQTIKVGGSTSAFRGDEQDTYRVYRAFVEDLSVSSRDPIAVLDDDLVRVNNRGVFS